MSQVSAFVAMAVVAVAGCVPACSAADGALPPAGGEYGVPVLWATLQDPAIHESSGLAASRTRPGVFWTHNDSGNPPVLFAVDRTGRTVQRVTIRGVENRDWEDLAAFRRNGVEYLVIADTGDNDRKYETLRLHMVMEPAADQTEIEVEQTIEFHYPDARYDCEAVAFDPAGERFLLVTKLSREDVFNLLRGQESEERVRVFAVPLPAAEREGARLVAEEIAQLPTAVVTAMDISADGRRAVVLTYFGALMYVRDPDEDWSAAFSRLPRALALPPLRKPEAICFGADSPDLYLTSEHIPAPLWRVPHKPGPAKQP